MIHCFFNRGQLKVSWSGQQKSYPSHWERRDSWRQNARSSSHSSVRAKKLKWSYYKNLRHAMLRIKIRYEGWSKPSNVSRSRDDWSDQSQIEMTWQDHWYRKKKRTCLNSLSRFSNPLGRWLIGHIVLFPCTTNGRWMASRFVCHQSHLGRLDMSRWGFSSML